MITYLPDTGVVVIVNSILCALGCIVYWYPHAAFTVIYYIIACFMILFMIGIIINFKEAFESLKLYSNYPLVARIIPALISAFIWISADVMWFAVLLFLHQGVLGSIMLAKTSELKEKGIL